MLWEEIHPNVICTVVKQENPEQENLTQEKPKEENTLEKIQWKYDDERVMNGGEVFNGIFGYNSLDDNFATI